MHKRPSLKTLGRHLVRHLFCGIVLFCVPLLSGCPELNAILQNPGVGGAARAVAPSITAETPRLVGMPTLRQLAAYYCPTLIANPILRLSCAVTLGPPPPPQALALTFAMPIIAKNPNNIPIPMLDILVATTLFPGQQAESLGAVCVSMCGANEPTCTGEPRPGGCAGGNAIRGIEDFAARIPNLIAGIATGAAQEELRRSTIVAGGDLRVTLSLVLGIEQALRVIEKVIQRTVEQALQNQAVTLDIPLSASGTVFVNLPAVGRMGVAWGPLTTTWQIR